jgi:hypothetical protein
MTTQITTRALKSVNGSAPLALIFLLWMAFGIFGIPAVNAFFTAVVIVLQCLLGIHLLCAIFPTFEFSVTGLVGPGFVVGSTIWVVPVQLAGSGAQLNFAVALTLLALLIHLVRRSKLKIDWSITDDFLGISGLAFVIMSNEWNQMIFVAILLLVALLIKNLLLLSTTQKTVLCWTLIAAAGISLLWGLQIQGPFWWIVTDDYSYYESLQIHLRDFGIWEPWGPSNISQYHWLNPAWVGQVSQITFADDWVTLTRVAPIVFSLAISATTIELIKHFLVSDVLKYAHFLMIIGCAFLFLVLRIDFSGTSTYGVFAVAATTILTLIKCVENPKAPAGWLLSLVMIFATTFAKLFSLPVVLCIASALLCASVTRGQRQLLTVLCGTAFASLVLYVGALIWLGQRLSNGYEGGWSVNVPNIATAARRLLPLTGSVAVPVLLSMVILARGKRASFCETVLLFGSFITLSLAFLAHLLIVPGFAITSDEYFMKPALYFALLIVVCVIATTTNRSVIAGAILGTALSIGLIQQFGAVKMIIALLPQSLVAVTRAELLTTQNWPVPVSMAVGIGIALLVVKKDREFGSYLSVALLGTVLVFFVHLGVDRAEYSLRKDNSPWASRETSMVRSVLGDTDLVDVGAWIEANTPRNSVIATNDLCARDSSKRLLLSDATELACAFFGVDYTLGHATKRRFLLLGPRFAYENPELRDSYMSVSLRFGQTPTLEIQQDLLKLGVDYFVALHFDRSNSNPFDDREVFSRGHYSVIDLHGTHELQG